MSLGDGSEVDPLARLGSVPENDLRPSHSRVGGPSSPRDNAALAFGRVWQGGREKAFAVERAGHDSCVITDTMSYHELCRIEKM